MISPLGQRQVLTTAALEAIRMAHEGAVHAQQVVARRQAMVDRMAEGLHEVHEVEETDGLKLDPDHQGQGSGQEGGGSRERRPGEPEHPEEGPAGSAEGHLDFLA